MNDIYIRQIAVSTSYSRMGIGSKIIKYLFEVFKDEVDYVSADIRKENKISQFFL